MMKIKGLHLADRVERGRIKDEKRGLKHRSLGPLAKIILRRLQYFGWDHHILLAGFAVVFSAYS